ncbi:hypothetical protein [Thiobacillus sp.]|uniref:hypothetical protein n=1 Tax=Thiobacillus sp. TaxID=924 RepID=UPI0011D6C467|nr:hypothetical protein [Thiobacillus sp.]TXH74912.1 MAG: hypothetical protein E6Q82_07935 [Thiobacillus sp.]
MDLPADLRLILVHKQKTSGRLRFLRLPHGTVAFTPLPPLSDLIEDAEPPQVVHHPAVFIKAAEDRLGLPAGSLAHEPEFQATVDTPDGPVAMHLASFTTIDPPFDEAAALGGSFIAITEAMGGMPVEMDLLRHAYEVLLG